MEENTRLTGSADRPFDTPLKDTFLREIHEQWGKWKPKLGSRDQYFSDFLDEHKETIHQILNADLVVKSIDETKRFAYIKAIKIETIYTIAILKLEMLYLERNKIIEDYIGELVREKLKNTSCLCFRVSTSGRIEVFFRLNQNEYAVVDGNEILPCSYHLLANSKWDNTLMELEGLINSPQIKEHDLQKFFEVYPELLLEKEFDTLIPQAVISPDQKIYDWKADFILSPFNQFEFAKILELKLPTVKTTRTKKPDHTSFTSQIWHSLRQIRDYAEAFDNTSVRTKFKEAYKVDIFRPDLHLVIGRSWDISQMDTIKKMKKDSQIKIETWDEMLARLKRHFS